MLVPVVDMKLTGRKIAALRAQRGISVRELQAMLGFATPQAIYKWQRGETLPTVENLAALACILSVPIEEILAVDCRKTVK
jgi:transcriptional regulator with XRE-family HTH domain